MSRRLISRTACSTCSVVSKVISSGKCYETYPKLVIRLNKKMQLRRALKGRLLAWFVIDA